MKQTEVSSGAVVVRKHIQLWDVLLIRDAKGVLTFPKGFVELHESIIHAARREAREETGITGLRYKATLPPITYIYTRSGKAIHKTVYYALFSYNGTGKLLPQQEEGISEILWVPITAACAIIGYPKTNIPIIQAVLDVL